MIKIVDIVMVVTIIISYSTLFIMIYSFFGPSFLLTALTIFIFGMIAGRIMNWLSDDSWGPKIEVRNHK